MLVLQASTRLQLAKSVPCKLRKLPSMDENMNRRAFFQSTAAVSMATLAIGAEPQQAPGPRQPMVASSNPKAVDRVMQLLKEGFDPLDAAIAGVAIVEADPSDHSVGYGGLPNEDGVVE